MAIRCERDLESWLWQHPEAFAQANGGMDGFRWVSRQAPLPQTGRIDLAGQWLNALIVVEVKWRQAREGHLIQVLRYCKELDNIRLESSQVPVCVQLDTYLWDWWTRDRVHPVVIAPSFTREALRTASLFGIRLIAFSDNPPRLERYPDHYDPDLDFTDYWEEMAKTHWVASWIRNALEGFLDDPMVRPQAQYLLAESPKE